MFGHDNQHHDNNLPAPDPDGALANDDQTIVAPQVADSAGDYIDDVPATPSVTQPSDIPAAPSAPVTDTTASTPAANDTTPDTDKLLEIKQQALQQLTPLVGHLEQTPEEKFRTTMMMIQAADNHELIAAAYEAAGQIADDKTRAQALLDIVNEINYFTHNNSNEA